MDASEKFIGFFLSHNCQGTFPDCPAICWTATAESQKNCTKTGPAWLAKKSCKHVKVVLQQLKFRFFGHACMQHCAWKVGMLVAAASVLLYATLSIFTYIVPAPIPTCKLYG